MAGSNGSSVLMVGGTAAMAALLLATSACGILVMTSYLLLMNPDKEQEQQSQSPSGGPAPGSAPSPAPSSGGGSIATDSTEGGSSPVYLRLYSSPSFVGTEAYMTASGTPSLGSLEVPRMPGGYRAQSLVLGAHTVASLFLQENMMGDCWIVRNATASELRISSFDATFAGKISSVSLKADDASGAVLIDASGDTAAPYVQLATQLEPSVVGEKITASKSPVKLAVGTRICVGPMTSAGLFQMPNFTNTADTHVRVDNYCADRAMVIALDALGAYKPPRSRVRSIRVYARLQAPAAS